MERRVLIAPLVLLALVSASSGCDSVVELGSSTTSTTPSSSSSGTGGGGGGGGDGGAPTCTSRPSPNPAGCTGPACSVAFDIEVRCTEPDFAQGGVRVGLTGAETYVATSSSDLSRVFAASLTGAQALEGVELPAAPIDLAVAEDGTLLLVGDVTTFGSPGDYPGGLTALYGKPGALKPILIHDEPERFSPFVDIAIGPNSDPHVWFISNFLDGPPFYHYGEATIEAGAAVLHDAVVPGYTGWVHFAVGADGSSIGFEASEAPYQLRTSIDGVVRALGTPTSTSLDYAVAALPRPASAETVPYAVALLDQPGIRVAFPTGSVGSQEIAVAGTQLLAPQCSSGAFPIPPTGCPGPCHEAAVGVEASAFSVARLRATWPWSHTSSNTTTTS